MIGRNRACICCHQQLRSYTAETFPGQLALAQASFLFWYKVLIRKEIDLLVMTRPSFFSWTFPRHPCGRVYNMSWAGIWMLWIWLLDVFALILIYTASSSSCLSGISILSYQPSPPCQQSCKENISYSTETRIGFSTWQQILCWWFFKRRTVRFKGPREADECRSGHLRGKMKEIIRSQGQGME